MAFVSPFEGRLVIEYTVDESELRFVPRQQTAFHNSLALFSPVLFLTARVHSTRL